jgi:hypothetical protein
MSTLHDTRQHRDSTLTRNGTSALTLAALIATGLALLILTPTGHHTPTSTTGSSAPSSQAAALTAQTPAPGGCFRDPANHALTCYHAASAPTATAAPAGYFRDPATHKLLRLPTARHRAGQHPANHSRGRIIP